MELRDYLRGLRRHWIAILLMTAVGAGAGYGWTLLQTPVYVANASGIVSSTLVDEGLNAPGADPLALRRFLDGRRVSDAEFDAYLSGTLHYLALLRRVPALPRRKGGGAARQERPTTAQRC